ncbi:DUF4865 family protein [Streptomyces sp. NPDC001634]|uniref:DUF4865 family protein n=1 Tax=Streptomyces sp. NPDC001634 TaxID=3154390 RepID=UPI003321B8BF
MPVLTAHYSIPLPADYDMGVIARRVADRSAPWDRRTGLLLKSFCVTYASDASAGGHNSYAPFYVWAAPDEFGRFLTGAEYAGLCAAFGPVPVHTGTVLQCSIGTGPVGHLVSETEPLGPVTDLRAIARAEAERHQAAVADPSVHSHVVDLDPATMTLTRRTLLHAASEAPRPKNSERVLRVLHLSRPPHTTTG